MVMDKGLSLREAEDFLSVAGEYADIIKLGFGTAVVTPGLREKIQLFQRAGKLVYFGGTLMEAFTVRGQLDDFLRVLDEYDMQGVEVSDGSIQMHHDEKCELIHRLSKNYRVLSEVGSKNAEVEFAPYKWIAQMKNELQAGSWKVVAEAREGGNVGIFNGSGSVRSGLIDEILTKIDGDRILWEAPNKSQQVWFIKLLGQNVNLGNIPYNEVIPLETLRLGLRGDTFMTFLSKELQEKHRAVTE